MGFEPEEILREETAENKFEGGGVDLDSGDLSAADPIAAPRRTTRERLSVRPRAVSAQKTDDRPASADQSRISRRAGAMSPPPIRKPIMRSNSEFGYLFNDSEPVDNYMDEQYSRRLDGLAYDGKGKDSDSQYSDLFEGEQQSMVRRPENRSSAAPVYASEPAPQATPQTAHRPRFSRRSRETSAAAAYAAAGELSAAELASRSESQPQSQPLAEPFAEPSAPPAEPTFAEPQPGAMPYPDASYPPDPYGEYGRRPIDPRGPYDMPPEYPPYGQYPVYPPNYPYPYPYGQYPMYPPYGYPPYGYPPAAYPPGYGYPPQPQEEARPAESEAVPMDNVPSPPPSFLRQPKAAEPAPVQPEPEPEPAFPSSVDSAEDEFAAVSAFAPIPEPVPEEPIQAPAPTPEPEPAAAPARERSVGSSRFNRRSRSGDSSPAPAENRSQGFGSAAAPTDLFGEDDPAPASKPNAGGGSSRFNRRSRS